MKKKTRAERRQLSKKTLVRHHYLPVSRFGKGAFIIVRHNQHVHWHALFGNLTPAEAILHILRYWNIGSIIDELTIASIVRMCGGRICEQEAEKT